MALDFSGISVPKVSIIAEALELISRMLQDPGRCSPNARTFVTAFKACTALVAKEDGQVVAGKLVKMVSLESGTALHVEAANSGFALDLFVSNTHAKCGALVCELMWLLSRRAASSHPGNRAKKSVASLSKAESLGKARARAVKGGFFLDLFMANTLIDVFAKCGDLEEARRIFYSMKQQDVVSWNVLMLGLAERDHLELFEEMES
ncbi:putative pentatricopeptide repeat-containing protein At5g13230, mitochondrial [Selaginella moellendorffii]|uniref:putative pentatricopeptide repeat-containing protein At5g13230, mitochondrial n=1 Tax=Selaginella moellendorffii TaxID=88036 RepID=UPI000D1C9538|nr:putative pentatricopeptide repeat-containing protein At5g13230, mitochondrial [Selaginella moellendorffii]|eukprot:XP_024520363.1 putative pentatricopeptide repeat-containing protein At5g13230, mitochondrial [Selaginella moellendorffii]